jgi:hypothetical protein
MSAGNETHDIVHTITGYIAQAIARRREDIEASGQYSGTPSRFNKITLKQDVIEDFTDSFERIFGYRIPFTAFEKVFEYDSPADYGMWFGRSIYPKIKKGKLKKGPMPIEQKTFRDIGYNIYRAVFGIGQTIPGIFAKQYWGDVDVSGIKIDPKLIDPDDPEMLQDLVLAALNDAKAIAEQTQQDRLGPLTAGMSLPGL